MNRLFTSLVTVGVVTVGVATVGMLSTICAGQEASQSARGKSTVTNRPKSGTTAEKRAWLRQEVAKGLSNSRQIRTVQAHIDLIQPQQIDQLANGFLAQQLPPADPQRVMQEAQGELARARALRQALEQEFVLWRNGNVGYAPVVTWLPQGTQMGASAVISPDRRYVRTNVLPFSSSVGPVYSYNLNTGETRRMPQYGNSSPRTDRQSGNPYSWPSLGYGQSNMAPVESAGKQKRWGYDQLHGSR